MQTETISAPAPRGTITYDMPRKDYDALDAVNFSTLKLMAKSPAHYWHRLMEGGRTDTNAMKLGRVRHMGVFEPERFRREVVAWDGGRRFGKEWDAFQQKHAGRELITADEMSECIKLATHVRTDRIASQYVSGGRGEFTLQWTHSEPTVGGIPGFNVQMKARPDFVTSSGFLVDLKTTRDASPGAFGRSVWNLHYFAQAAVYVDGYEAATGQRLPFVFVAAEIDVPHVVTVYRMPDHVLELGRETYRAWLQRLAECRRTSSWPGYFEAEAELSLPSWAVGNDDEEDLTGLDLEIGQ